MQLNDHKRTITDDQTAGILARRIAKDSLRHRILTKMNIDFKYARSFFQYANSRMRGRERLPPLISGDNTTTTSSDKADLSGGEGGILPCCSVTAVHLCALIYLNGLSSLELERTAPCYSPRRLSMFYFVN